MVNRRIGLKQVTYRFIVLATVAMLPQVGFAREQPHITRLMVYSGDIMLDSLKIWVLKDRTCFVSITERPRIDDEGHNVEDGTLADGSRRESRYKFQLQPSDLDELEACLNKQNFYNLKIRHGSPLPDEMRTIIDAVLTSGKKCTAWKWYHDKSANLDAIFEFTYQYVERAKSFKPIYKGEPHEDWQPN